jgi:phosphatidylserine/phosphatidylglycerophosphate/cardiolipin synthase-like enzyme
MVGESADEVLRHALLSVLAQIAAKLEKLPIDQPLAVLRDIRCDFSAFKLAGAWEAFWQEIWRTSKIQQIATFVEGSGLAIVDDWLDRGSKEGHLLLVISIHFALERPRGTGEAVVGLLLGNVATSVESPIAQLHRPQRAQGGIRRRCKRLRVRPWNGCQSSQLSNMTEFMLRAAVTPHQKSVMLDYELPDRAVGFVMGHNMLDEYWDTDAHSGLNRGAGSKPAPNKGARGFEPRQDISCQISGPILKDLHHNFATAWLKETGEDLLHLRAASTAAKFECTPGSTRQVAQLLRTQAQVERTKTEPKQAAVRDIERAYLQAVNNATQFIYIENQYFRWPPLAEAIKATAANLVRAGRDPVLHGSLHLFVITNATKEGVGAGTVNTHRMLESLGRADTIPGIAKLKRIEEIKKNAPPKPRPDKLDFAGQREIAKWEEQVNRQVQEVNDSKIEIQAIPGLKVHVCSLVATDTPAGKPWVPVYIHSKLMIVDDVFTTHGSANINTRSMMVDSELNIAHEWGSVTRDLRRRLWGMYTGGIEGQENAHDAFDIWRGLIKENKEKKDGRGCPDAPLVGFYFGEIYVRNWD